MKIAKFFSVIIAAITFVALTAPTAQARKSSSSRGAESQQDTQVNFYEIRTQQQYREKLSLLTNSIHGMREFSQCNFNFYRQNDSGNILKDSINLGTLADHPNYLDDHGGLHYDCINEINCVRTVNQSTDWSHGYEHYAFNFTNYDTAMRLAPLFDNLIQYCRGSESMLKNW